MANVLGELFGSIAGAIREKTGDTATMKPAEFPDKIRAIEAGGGGSDGSDVGLLKPELPLPSGISSIGCAFVYKGDLYVCTVTGSANDAILKLSGDAWEQICTVGGFNGGYSNRGFGYAYICEYNGEVHFLNGESKTHYKFDGAEFISVSTLTVNPKSTSSLFVEDGKFRYLASDSYVYEFDGTTWTKTAYSCSLNPNYGSATLGGVLYWNTSTGLYIYDHGVTTLVASNKGDLFEFNNAIYSFKRNSANTLIYKLVGTDYETVATNVYAHSGFCVYNDRLHLFGGTSHLQAHVSMALE